MPESKRWVVTISGDRLISDVAKNLTEAGFAVDEVHEFIGSISGSADAAIVKRLRAIPGVADISPEVASEAFN